MSSSSERTLILSLPAQASTTMVPAVSASSKSQLSSLNTARKMLFASAGGAAKNSVSWAQPITSRI